MKSARHTLVKKPEKHLRDFVCTFYVNVCEEKDGVLYDLQEKKVTVEVRAYTHNAAARKLEQALCDLVERTR
jgi:hypothetical protein